MRPGRLARDLGDFHRADLLELIGGLAAGLPERLEIFQARARADAGQCHRQQAIRRVQRRLQRRIGAHRQSDEMRLGNLQMIEHRDRVGVEMLVGVAVGRRRHVRGRIAARGIGDAAMAAREVAHLRLPIGVVGREFVHEENGRSAAHLFEIEADIVARDGMRHFGFLLLSRAIKLAGNAVGGNAAALISFRHLTCAEIPRKRFCTATSFLAVVTPRSFTTLECRRSSPAGMGVLVKDLLCVVFSAFRRLLVALALCVASVAASSSPALARSHHGAKPPCACALRRPSCQAALRRTCRRHHVTQSGDYASRAAIAT